MRTAVTRFASTCGKPSPLPQQDWQHQPGVGNH